LSVADHVWIGEEVLILSLAPVTIESHVCLSQRAFICTGSHDFLAPGFDLVTKPVTIREGGSRYQLFTDGTIDLSKLVGREVHANGTISKPAVSSDEHKATTVVDAIPKMTVKTLRETGSAC